MSPLSHLVLSTVLSALSLTSVPTYAQIAVISHPSASVDNLSTRDLRRVYTGETALFSDLCIQRNLSDEFFQKVAGKKDYAIRQLWVQLVLSGRVSRGPTAFRSDAEVIEHVRQTPGAIGFVSRQSVTGSVKVLRIDGKQPGEVNYTL